MDENIIEITGVSFKQDTSGILEDINLVIKRGEFLGIIGPNGAGKTTLLKLILGLIKPNEGTIKLFGEDIHRFKKWYKIGYIPQHALNFDSNFPVSVYEVVSMGRFSSKGLFRKLGKEDMQAIDDALEIVGMKDYKNRRIGELSGGQQQRVFIARALASKPELLILDEPTVGVDITGQKEFYDFLERLHNEKKITLVLVTHDVSNISSRVRKIACINKRMFTECHPEELFGFGPEGMKVVHHLHGE
ncbi:MAG: metal ABC transporter ATP-binding protein [Candidatus Methanoperedens sp.]|nr:metal ABC transporter ATP-binding protein [Candidatus Methanoperedens sp.]MCZ7371911.1 metal ABC transporter ATP-binding protein [Candidatus Methanoperedens sp.]